MTRWLTAVWLLLALPLYGDTSIPVINVHDLVIENGAVVFQLEAPGVRDVFLAGSFNGWGNNAGGRVTDPKFAMQKIGATRFRTAVRLEPGEHRFKYVIDNDIWVVPPGFSRDGDGNAIFTINNEGTIMKNQSRADRPHRSFYDIPFSNGFSSAKFNLKKRMVDSFKNHIYSNVDEHTPSVNLVESVDFMITGPDTGDLKLSSLELESAEYLNGTGMVKAVYRYRKQKLNGYYFCSFQQDYNNLQVLIELPGRFDGEITSTIVRKPAVPAFTVSENRAGNWYHCSLEQGGKLSSRATRQSPRKVLNNEIAFWKKWRKPTKYPKGLSRPERQLYDQSLAILKMGQCREPGRSYGQILASLPPGHWNICWIRDAAYAIHGLTLANHLNESRSALEFFLKADSGHYEQFTCDGNEAGIGVPYQISVCRYFGAGSEESDGGDDPNIEIDGFGLFLWALDEYVQQSGDMKFLKKYWKTISKKVADVLVQCIDPEYRVIRPDSSIWERHIRSNGKQNGFKRFTYTTITAIRGLEAAEHLALRMQNPAPAEKYRRAHQQLRLGFFCYQVDEDKQVIKNSVEDQTIERYMDAAVVEAINYGIVRPQDIIARKTIAAFDQYLGMKNRPHGYFRSRDGEHYDNQEWVVLDLRIAAALKKMKQKSKADRLIKWVTDQARCNYNIIAELYDENTADYSGAIPMCGFGPGAYIAALYGD